ncbi:MAG: ATP-dependent RecD-like DNA helicase [Deltaproteobacteria bacterium]|nr:ATP-dependent RecD-like DNA helicase [Deltaproteobacteria bacterium]
MITLEGHLEHITYHNKENNYTVAKLSLGQARNPVTIIGHMAGVSPGQSLKIEGHWQTHPKYGQQFKVQSYDVTIPATVDGIRKYLESGAIKGMGPSMANRLVTAFGAETFEIIEKNPERLTEIEGIGETKADMIRIAWQDHHGIRGLMKFLQDMQVQTSMCAKIYNEYGPDAVEILRTEPYQLADDFPGVGFVIADTIARNLGLEKAETDRVRAAILHLIYTMAEDGHTFVEEQNLIVRCENLFKVDRDSIDTAIEELIAENLIVAESVELDTQTRALYLKELHLAETGLANRLKALLSVPLPPANIDTEQMAAEVQKKLAINLSAEQLDVLEQIFSHRISIITGGPGTGKTTLLRSITTIFEALGKRVQLAAPTGRAARRLADVTGRKAKTIHRLLGYNFTDGQFIRNQDNPLEADAIIVDEASMVDTLLMYNFLKAVPASAVLVLVGDVFQLPSIGPGNVLADIIQSDCMPVFYLKKIFRQDRESPIVRNAHRVRAGESPEFEPSEQIDGDSEFYFLEQSAPEQVVSTIVQLCRQELPRHFGLDPVNDLQVLTPMHKGPVGTINLNHVLQDALNPNPVLQESIGSNFKVNDKVMHLKNNYQKDVYNGDIGSIHHIDKKSGQITVDYYGRRVEYDATDLDEITVAYAISVHKSQGSEYPAVIIPLLTQHYIMLQRNLLYTAMTRGKKLVILIGTQKALSIALKNDKPRQRLSRLCDRLM